MNSTELRIGNWVLHKGIPTEISSIGKNMLRPPYMSIMCRIDDFAPISLTPSILEDAGFKNNRYGFYEIYIGGGALYIDCNDERTTTFLSKGDDEYAQEIDLVPTPYLHQLQNLYYALKGVELTINIFNSKAV